MTQSDHPEPRTGAALASRGSLAPHYSAAIFICALGSWGLYSQVAILFGADFPTILRWLTLPIVGTLVSSWIAVRWINRTEQPFGKTEAAPQSPPGSTTISIALLLLTSTGVCIALEIPWLYWSAAAAYFGWLILRLKPRSFTPATQSLHTSVTDWVAIALAILIAALITLSLGRANDDDAYYVNAIASTLDHPERPVLAFDGMHDNLSLPNHLAAAKRQTYELLVATLSALTRIDHEVLYYTVLPVFFSGGICLAGWLLLKRLDPKHAAINLIALLGLLVVWNAGGRSFGLWSFTMLYPGKSVFLTLMIPLLVYYSIRLADSPGPITWMMLFMAQSAAASLSSSAALIAPLAAGLVFVATVLHHRQPVRLALWTLAAVLPALFVLASTWLDLQAGGGLGSEGQAYGPFEVFGNNVRGFSAFAALLLMPLLAYQARLTNAGLLLCYLAISVLILFNPAIQALLASTASLLTWRSVWAIPAPAMIALSAGCLAQIWRKKSELKAVDSLPPLLLLALTGVFLLAGPTTINDSGVSFAPAKPRARNSLPYAVHIMERSRDTDLVLVPEQIAVPLAGLRGAPLLVAVRGIYSDHMRHNWPTGESEARKRLQQFVTEGGSSVDEWLWVLKQIEQRGITFVVLAPNAIEREPAFRTALEQRGFSRVEDAPVEYWIAR
jgi:Family of unknown function (DUF6077)